MTAPRRTRARGFAAWNPRPGILRDAIEARRDLIASDAVLAVEARDRAALVAMLGGGDD